MVEERNDTGRGVVITGIGVVSSIGIGRNEFWRNLVAGKSGISEVPYNNAIKFSKDGPTALKRTKRSSLSGQEIR